jgi:spermidine/putrescine transport system permease protein
MNRRPFFLAGITWLYVIWSLAPVLIAIQFSFNDGRSRSTWQGFSTRWYWGDVGSVAADPSLRLALSNTLQLALLTTLIATPLGVALALGLTRWRGRTSRAANGLMLLPLATPEIVMGSALFLVFTNLYTMVPLGRTAQLLGHVTFSVSYVVVIVRARLQSIGSEYEVAARDLGATPIQALRTILIPLLAPAVLAGALIVFASSMDDFVISAFLSPDAGSVTVPIKLYSAVRSSPSPALNALATLLLLGSTLALVLAWYVLRRRRAGAAASGSALKEMASIDI